MCVCVCERVFENRTPKSTIPPQIGTLHTLQERAGLHRTNFYFSHVLQRTFRNDGTARARHRQWRCNTQAQAACAAVKTFRPHPGKEGKFERVSSFTLLFILIFFTVWQCGGLLLCPGGFFKRGSPQIVKA